MPTTTAELEHPCAKVITRKSKSNLAFAFSCLPRERRQDMVTFYAFCRVVDDIADDPETPVEVKKIALQRWKNVLAEKEPPSDDPPGQFEREILAIKDKYQISPDLFIEIVKGMEMDLTIKRYATWEDLRQYCYRVASAVGLISIEIFGYRNKRCREYAIHLGYAFQLTNIMRDIGEDLREDQRIYLPQEDMERYGVTESDISKQRHSDAFVSLMQFQHQRALSYYNKAAALLPSEDRKRMIAARMMREIYFGILKKMSEDDFRVFSKRYKLSKLAKMKILLQAWVERLSSRGF